MNDNIKGDGKNRWSDDHEYRFPDVVEELCPDYFANLQTIPYTTQECRSKEQHSMD